jgi:ComF family protein
MTLSAWSPARIGGRILDLAFPPACAGCHREGAALCEACRRPLESRRGLPPGVALGLPSTTPLPLLQLEWCAPYTGTVRAAVRGLKYGGERRLADVLGSAVADRWREAGRGGEVLVPVPVHASRRRERGFDQADLIARSAASHLGLPVVPALVRTRATVRQYSLDRPDRESNVADAFAIFAPEASPMRDRWVVLVDDVATTGATLVACARTLLGAGAAGVSAVTVAREI